MPALMVPWRQISGRGAECQKRYKAWSGGMLLVNLLPQLTDPPVIRLKLQGTVQLTQSLVFPSNREQSGGQSDASTHIERIDLDGAAQVGKGLLCMVLRQI